MYLSYLHNCDQENYYSDDYLPLQDCLSQPLHGPISVYCYDSYSHYITQNSEDLYNRATENQENNYHAPTNSCISDQNPNSELYAEVGRVEQIHITEQSLRLSYGNLQLEPLYASNASSLAQESAVSHVEVIVAAQRERVFHALKKILNCAILLPTSAQTIDTAFTDVLDAKEQGFQLTSKLVKGNFCQIHRSYLINVHRRQSARTLLYGRLTRIYNIYGLTNAAWVKLQNSFGMTHWTGQTKMSRKEACRKDLYVLVADGTFGMHPVEAGKKAQLYCIHGVCSGGVEVPLLHSVTDRKTIAVYKKIFGHIKKHLTLPRSRTLRVILDFEKASIRAARMVFLNFEIDPPVPEGHVAHAKCVEFLDYLKTTWMEECMKIFGVNGLSVNFVPGTQNPYKGPAPIVGDTAAPFTQKQSRSCAPGEQRTLRRKDQARKDKINEAMQKMQQERERGLSTAEVMLYCRRMSTYLSEKGV
ncbi:hypothetical protein ANCDUO_02189 [Ancylostoma duodenale]|uniref:MULE transposase domain-containing protein n=1 Tax=Ancylostoma duodenale TaxID=51022 RepID=A0A0C2DCA8_9BILA|nr:hypothetical protein ANCDUO_02189 [Ancylostoma duodenale]